MKDASPIPDRYSCDIHQLVVTKTQGDQAGQYSKFQRRMAGSKVKLAGPEETPALIDDVGQWLNQAESTPDNAIEEHFKLVSKHPFPDGNDRTANFLMHLDLIRVSYPHIITQPEHRPDYINRLEKAQFTGDNTGFKIFSWRG